MLRVSVLVVLMLALTSVEGIAQTYEDSLLQWQLHYKLEFVTEPHSPLKAEDTGYLRFFPIDKRWRVLAKVEMSPDAAPFDMATHSGKTKKFRQWAVLRFRNPVSKGKVEHTLSAYERVDRPASDTAARITLFIPFNDASNGEQTYGGGRYMDIPKADVKNGYLILDFNKAYNPYCAFAEGYSCPIPPAENKLLKAVTAGEMVWTKEGVH
jgi:uncharacterized protein (DUF1684 family)